MSDTLTPTQDVTKLRRIKALNFPKIKRGEDVDRPDIKWIKVHKLRINDEYQRKLSNASMDLIRKIVSGWDWSKFHAPVVVQITPDTGKDDDTYEVLDGQHTSTAAASHGGIREIPCLIVKADSLIEKAEAFVGLNQDKLRMSPLDVFWAKVTAKDEDALEVVDGVQRAGAKIVKRPPPYGDFEVGETRCTADLLDLAKKGGSVYVRRVMEVGVQAGLAPVRTEFIRAFYYLLLEEGPTKLEGSYEEVRWQIAQAVRRHEVHDLIDTARRNHRLEHKSVGYHLALIIKQDIARHVSK